MTSRSFRNAGICAFAAVGVAFWCAGLAGAAEIFVLKSGGTVRGDWLNKTESPRETFVIRTEAGGQITFDKSQVEQVVLLSPAELLYEKIRPTFPDTVAGHEKLAAWCLEKQLVSRRRAHLARIIELDPNHEEARVALGYTRTAGEWLTRDELMASRGMILYKGRYRTRQEVELWEEERKQELAEKEWHRKLKLWRGWLATPEKGPQTAEMIKAIRDPYAVAALASYLEADEPRAVKLLLIETLAEIPGGAALKALVDRSLQDVDREVRLSALDAIVRADRQDSLNMYIAALRSKDNAEVNRAAIALRRLENSEAVEPLFDALVTEHKFKVQTGQPGQMSTTFRPGGGGGGLSFGGGGPKIVKQDIRNREVLNALIQLTGENFNYQTAQWKEWYASRARTQQINTRRD